jgi:pyrimidine and pyridine-specific 5'-nucleotidase
MGEQQKGIGHFITSLTFNLADGLRDERLIVWFDIDNTLYSASSNIAEEMAKRIHGLRCTFAFRALTSYSLSAYTVSLGLSEVAAHDLNLHYYSTYGLSLRGLMRHYAVGEVASQYAHDGEVMLTTPYRPVGF